MTTAVRTGMTDLIDEVRRLVGDPSPPPSTSPPAKWADADIQDALDDHRLEVYREPLKIEPLFTSSTVEYRTYRSAHDHYEITTGGTAIFVVETASGVDAGTANYTPDYRRGVVTFGADQMGTAYYLTGRSYDVHGAAADVLDWWVAKEPYECLTDSDGRQFFDRTKARARSDQRDTYRRRERPTYAALARMDA